MIIHTEECTCLQVAFNKFFAFASLPCRLVPGDVSVDRPVGSEIERRPAKGCLHRHTWSTLPLIII